MRTKNILKVLSVIIALSLMISAFPLNFVGLFGQKESQALENTNYQGISFDANGNVDNIDKATYSVSDSDGNIAYIWLSECKDIFYGRSYLLDIYTTSNKPFTLYTKDVAVLNYSEDGISNCLTFDISEFPVDDSVFGTSNEMYQADFTLDCSTPAKSVAQFNVIIDKSGLEIANETLFAFKFGDSDTVVSTFPATGLGCAPISAPQILNASANNVIVYSSISDLKANLDTSKIDGPFEAYIFGGDISTVATENVEFEEVFENASSLAKSKGYSISDKITFDDNTYTIGSDLLKTEVSNTYSLLLKDKYNHSIITVFKTERETVKVSLNYVTEDASGNKTPITKDANNNNVTSIENIFIEKNEGVAKLEKTLPKIYGYVYKSVSTGTVVNSKLSKDLLTDTEIFVVYEAIKPNAEILNVSTNAIVSPTNDLNKATNPHNIVYTVSSLINNGNTKFIDTKYTLGIPQVDNEGTTLSLSNIKFVTGTYVNCSPNATLDVYEIVKGEKKLIEAGIPVSTSKELDVSRDATAIEVVFSTNAWLTNAQISTKPYVTAELGYKGLSESFDIVSPLTFVATYLDSENEVKTLEVTSSATTKVDNPVYTLTIKYVDLATGKDIKTAVTKKYQVYDKIETTFNAPKINQYIYNKTSNLNLIENYDASTKQGYMSNKDIEIEIGYYEKKPYIADTVASGLYNSVYANDKQTIYFNGLGAYLVESTQEGNVPMYGYTLLFNIPANFSAKSLTLPMFSGDEVPATVYYRYAGTSAWSKYTTDSNNEEVSVTSKSLHTLNISNMYKKGNGALEIKVVYGDSATMLPKDFKAQQNASVYGIVISDSASELNVTLETSTTYMKENADGTNEDTTFSKKCNFSTFVYQPSIAEVNKSANLTVIESDIYTYRFKNIANNGNTKLDNYTFSYEIPANTYIHSIVIDNFENQTGTYKINLMNNNDIVATINADFSEKFEFINDNQYMEVTSIEIEFGSVDVGFAAEEGIELSFYSTLEDKDTETYTGKGYISAQWTSVNNADNSNEILKNFTTSTKVSAFTELTSAITTENNVVLKEQSNTVIINSFENHNTIDIFNFVSEINAIDNSPITSVETGAYSFNTNYDIAKLQIFAHTVDGETIKVFDNEIPTTSETISTPDETIKVVFKFTVLPQNTTSSSKAKVTFTMKGIEDTVIKENISYNAGTIETDNTNLSEDDISSIGNIYKTTSSANVITGIPATLEPNFSVDGTGFFKDKLTYKIDDFENNGNINLYQTTFVFTRSEYEDFVDINIGEWKEKVSGSIQYITANSALEALEGTSPFILYKNFNDVTSLESIEIPKLEDDVIILVAIVINTVEPNNGLVSPATCTTQILSDVVKPNDVIETELALGSFYGIVKDGNNITSDELLNLIEIESSNDVIETTVIKPAVLYPTTIVSKDILEYRERFTYTISDIKNTGNTTLSSFEIVNAFSPSVRFLSLTTPEFNELLEYNVYYRVNTKNDWILLQEKVGSRESIEIFAPELNDGEYVTDIKLSFTTDVSEGFASSSDMVINCINWSDAYSIDDVINNTEVNGQNNGTTVSGRYSVAYTPEIPSILKSDFKVEIPEKIYPLQKITIKYSNVKNATEATIEDYALTQEIGKEYTVLGLNTGSYEAGYSNETIKVLYKTNLSKEGQWFLLTDKVKVSDNTYLEFPELEENEYITLISLRYGDAKPSFTQIESPSIIISPTEELKNSSEYELESSLVGVIDGKSFGEIVNSTLITDFGFVNVIVKDENNKQVTSYKVYGNVGDKFNIKEIALKGYSTVSVSGDTNGVFKLGESGQVTFICDEVPKTGYNIFLSWNFLTGFAILAIVGFASILSSKKKKQLN